MPINRTNTNRHLHLSAPLQATAFGLLHRRHLEIQYPVCRRDHHRRNHWCRAPRIGCLCAARDVATGAQGQRGEKRPERRTGHRPVSRCGQHPGCRHPGRHVGHDRWGQHHRGQRGERACRIFPSRRTGTPDPALRILPGSYGDTPRDAVCTACGEDAAATWSLIYMTRRPFLFLPTVPSRRNLSTRTSVACALRNQDQRGLQPGSSDSN